MRLSKIIASIFRPSVSGGLIALLIATPCLTGSLAPSMAQEIQPGATVQELDAMQSEFSDDGDLSAAARNDSERALIEGAAMSEQSIMDAAFNGVDDTSDSSAAGQEQELRMIEEGDIGIQTREPLERLQTPDELKPLQRKERLKSLSLAELEAKTPEGPGVLTPLRSTADLRGRTETSDTTAGQWSRITGTGFLQDQLANPNVRSSASTTQSRRDDDLVRMNNSGRMVLSSRVEREEFKKRQERRSSYNTGSSSSSSSGASYLPGNSTQSPGTPTSYLPGN